MTHDQLARVFPDGRTVHVPTDGKPLKGYDLALADIEKRGAGDDAATVGKKPGIFAALFKGGKSSEDDEEAVQPPPSTPSPLRQLSWPPLLRHRKPRLQPPSSWLRPTRRSCPRLRAKPEAKVEAKAES